MNKFFIIIAFCFSLFSASAQIEKLPNLLSNNQQLVQNAVETGFIVIKQTYQLCDTTQNPPQYYGRNNENFFGQIYSFAVKTDSGFFCFDNVINPWNYDPDFEEYKNSTKYKPVIYKTYYREIENPQFVEFSSSLDSIETIADNQIYHFDTEEFTSGFELDTLSKNEGWLIWPVLTANHTFEDSSAFSFIIYRNTPQPNNENNNYSVKLPSEKKVTEGIFVQPVYSGVGKLNFILTGMAKSSGVSAIVYPLASCSANQSRKSDIILTPIEISNEQNPDVINSESEKKIYRD